MGKLDLKTMRIILAIDMENCKEERLWDAILKWADYQSSNKKKKVNHVNDDDYKQNDDDDEANNVKAYRLYLLKSVRDLMRFGLMDSVYFSKFVEPEKVLSGNELLVICLYFMDKDRGCGKFSVKPRGIDEVDQVKKRKRVRAQPPPHYEFQSQHDDHYQRRPLTPEPSDSSSSSRIDDIMLNFMPPAQSREYRRPNRGYNPNYNELNHNDL